jgi:hypothetical protein
MSIAPYEGLFLLAKFKRRYRQNNMEEEKTGVLTGLEQVETVTEIVAEATVKQEKTFTQKQIDEMMAKTQSTFEGKAAAERAKAEESRKLADLAAERAAQLERRIAEIEAEKDREWEESVGGTQEGQTLIEARRRLKAKELVIAEREKAANDKYTAGEYGLRAANAMDFAALYNVDYKLLVNEKSPAEMKARALEIALDIERAKKTEPKPEPVETESITPAHVDSGVITTRSSKLLTKESLNKLYADGDIDRVEYEEGLRKV